jgi:hypothetical protein
MFIVYTSDSEVIVTAKANEKKAIKEWFTEGGRDIEEYDREEVKEDAVAVSSRMKARW